jgi:hypothetical protein
MGRTLPTPDAAFPESFTDAFSDVSPEELAEEERCYAAIDARLGDWINENISDPGRDEPTSPEDLEGVSEVVDHGTVEVPLADADGPRIRST